VLEIGCGNGVMLAELRQRGEGPLFGVDFSAGMLANLGRNVSEPVPVALARAGQLPFRAASFGSAACVNTIYNLATREALGEVVEEMARVLRPGGRAVFEIRNEGNPLIRYCYRRMGNSRHPLWAHELLEVERELERAGLRLQRAIPVLAPFLFWAPAIVIVARR
jgi:ubiquinone/menaquinone biosynthesis C-methylase UbiE